MAGMLMFGAMVSADNKVGWREILDSLSDAVLAVSPEFDILAVNAAAETLLGASPIRRPFFERLLRENQWLATMIRKCLTSGQSLNSPETDLQLDRRGTIVRAEVSPLIDQAGHSHGVVILLHDLSHQQGVETSLRSGDALGLSPAGLAHEVKNPLTGIKGAAELLASMFTDARARQYCGLILDGVARITALVEQVLAVSGPHRLKFEPLNIHRVLHEALRMAGAHPVPPTGVLVEQLFDPSLPEVIGDAAALERVFLNLIRNALEALAAADPTHSSATAHSGGATDAAETAVMIRKVRLKTALETQFRMTEHGRRRQFLRVEISDNGKGMAPEEIQQLFTPFFTTKANGTGLGLVLSQRIVALHGGKLWAQVGSPGQNSTASAPDQSPDRGMTFCVTLPIGPA